MTRGELVAELGLIEDEITKLRFQIMESPPEAEIDATEIRDKIRELASSSTLERFPERLPRKFPTLVRCVVCRRDVPVEDGRSSTHRDWPSSEICSGSGTSV